MSPSTPSVEVVMQPGFWDKTPPEQVAALSKVNPKFRDASADAQMVTLQSLRRLTSTGVVQQPPAQPPTSAVAPSPNQGPAPAAAPKPYVRHTPGLKPSRYDPTPASTPMAEFARPALTGAMGAVTGAIPRMMGASKPTQDFTTGLGEGVADVGVDLTSVTNALLTAGTMGAGKLAQGTRYAKVAMGLQKWIARGFAVGAGADALINEFPEAAVAYHAGDYRGAGRALAHGLADLAFVRLGVKQGADPVDPMKYGKPSVPAELPPPAPAPPGRADLRRARASIVQQITDMLSQRDQHPQGSPEFQALQQRIQETTALLNQMVDAERGPASPPAPTPPGPIPVLTTPEQRVSRQKAATERVKTQDVTAPWRQGREGMGVRLAPEETGELPTQPGPISRPIGPTQIPPQAKAPPVPQEPVSQMAAAAPATATMPVAEIVQPKLLTAPALPPGPPAPEPMAAPPEQPAPPAITAQQPPPPPAEPAPAEAPVTPPAASAQGPPAMTLQQRFKRSPQEIATEVNGGKTLSAAAAKRMTATKLKDYVSRVMNGFMGQVGDWNMDAAPQAEKDFVTKELGGLKEFISPITDILESKLSAKPKQAAKAATPAPPAEAAPAAPPPEPTPTAAPPAEPAPPESQPGTESAAPAAPAVAPDLYDAALAFAKKQGTVSEPSLQREFQISHSAAAEIVDRMDEAGLLEPYTGSWLPRRLIGSGGAPGRAPIRPPIRPAAPPPQPE